MKQIFVTAALAAAAVMSTAAHAVIIESGNLSNPAWYKPDAASGKTSPYAGNAGIFIETFDQRTGGCGLTTNAVVSGGTYGYASGSVPNVRAAPLGDSTCYAYGPGPNGTLPNPLPPTLPANTLATVTVSYQNLFLEPGFPPGGFLNYLGMYYGSIDEYNMIEFFSGDNATGSIVATVTGAQILANCGTCSSGDQQSDDTNVYVNILFEPTDPFNGFRSFRFSTWGVAIEIDNVAVGVGVTPVPEPASLALLGAGLAALGLSRRRKAVK